MFVGYFTERPYQDRNSGYFVQLVGILPIYPCPMAVMIRD